MFSDRGSFFRAGLCIAFVNCVATVAAAIAATVETAKQLQRRLLQRLQRVLSLLQRDRRVVLWL